MNIKKNDGGLLLEDHQGNCIGKLSGHLDDNYYVITKIECENNIKLFFDYLKETLPDIGLTVLSWKGDEDRDYEKILESLGYKISFEKAYYARSILNYRSNFSDPFEYSPLIQLDFEIIKKLFDQTRVGYIDLKFSVEEAMERTFGSLDGPYVANWKVAKLNGELAGLLMPEIFTNKPSEGTLAYMGLIPKFRGKHYGKILHAKVLEEIGKLDAITYLDSTAAENNQMIKVFEANNCSSKGVRRYWHKC